MINTNFSINFIIMSKFDFRINLKNLQKMLMPKSCLKANNLIYFIREVDLNYFLKCFTSFMIL